MAKKSFSGLTEREILALAIQLEEEDSRVYGDFAEGLREMYPATAKAFDEMQAEESRHRSPARLFVPRRMREFTSQPEPVNLGLVEPRGYRPPAPMLIEMHRQRFGDHIPLIRRQDVKGFLERRPTWLVRPLGIQAVRKQVEIMELETRLSSSLTPINPNSDPLRCALNSRDVDCVGSLVECSRYFDLITRKLHGLLLVVQFVHRLGRGVVQNELGSTLHAA
jgi:hypothetical protein